MSIYFRIPDTWSSLTELAKLFLDLGDIGVLGELKIGIVIAFDVGLDHLARPCSLRSNPKQSTGTRASGASGSASSGARWSVC